MANTPFTAQSRPVATTLTDAYAVGAGNAVTISTILIHNTGAVSDEAIIKVAPAAAVDATIHQAVNVTVPADATITLTLGWTAGTTDVIRVRSEQGTSNFHLYGLLTTP